MHRSACQPPRSGPSALSPSTPSLHPHTLFAPAARPAQEANEALFSLTEELAGREAEVGTLRASEAALQEEVRELEARLAAEVAAREQQVAAMQVGGGAGARCGGCGCARVVYSSVG